jgi:hypothetical protein
MSLLHPPPLPETRDATELHGLIRLIGYLVRAPAARRRAARALKRAKRCESSGRTEDAYKETRLALEMLDEKLSEYWNPFVFPYRTEATFQLERLARELGYPVPRARLREHCEALRMVGSIAGDQNTYAEEIAYLQARIDEPSGE